jgi:hypothetical protein
MVKVDILATHFKRYHGEVTARVVQILIFAEAVD